MVAYRRWSLIYVLHFAAVKAAIHSGGAGDPAAPVNLLIYYWVLFLSSLLLQVEKEYLPVEWENLSLKQLRELSWIKSQCVELSETICFEWWHQEVTL